jgi:hypothetical protein
MGLDDAGCVRGSAVCELALSGVSARPVVIAVAAREAVLTKFLREIDPSSAMPDGIAI